MDMPEKIPAITAYQQALNAYNPNVYSAHKKITAEEWNALMLSLFAQGNRQEYYLEQIINGHLTELVETINDIIDSITTLEGNMLDAITLAINAHNTGDTNPHENVLNPIRNRLTATEGVANSTKTLAESNEGRIDDLETLGETHNDELVALRIVDAGLRTNIDATTIIANNAKDFALDSYKSVTYNGTTGELTFTRNDATKTKIDLPLENIISSGYYDAATKELALVMVSGDEIRIPAEDLVDDYFGSTSANIDINISAENIISAVLKSGTITEAQLATALATKLNAKANTADLSAVASSGLYGDIIGTPFIPTKTSELTNNSDFTTNTKVDTEVSRIDGELADKQPTLVNQVNLKSVNNNSLLGSGNIDLSGTMAPLVNNLTDGGTTSALTAEMGKELDINKANLDYVDTQDSTQLALAKAYSDTEVSRIDVKKLDVAQVVDNLTSTSTTSALSANMGKSLQDTKQDRLTAGANITIAGSTISATQPDISTKQDKLTAGDNITIENNVISASGGGGGGDAANVYDLIIRTQAEFNDLIADPTWFDAKSVAFVGQFTLSTANNSGVKRPANVTRIDGYNNAKITVTNFEYNSSTPNGGLWDDGNVNNPRCYINDLNVDCQGKGGGGFDGYGYGFSGNNSTYTNCTGTGTGKGGNNYGYGYGYGFFGNNNIYTNCTGTGTGTVGYNGYGGYGYGFSGNNNTYTNCTGTGTGTGGYGFGFNGTNNIYTNCTGTGTGTKGDGYGFFGTNNIYTNCTGTGTGSNNYGGYGFSGNNNIYTNCTGTGTGTSGSYGFNGDKSTYTNCTGTGTGSDNGDGFSGDKSIYTNCTGTGTGTSNSGDGFIGSNNTYTNCTGTGTSGGNYCYGFKGSNNRIISCTALAYKPTGSAPSGDNCVPIYNASGAANLFMIIKDCKFPQIAKTGYQQGTIWCNIANNNSMVGSIKDNVYHSRFTVAPIKGPNVVADNNSVVDITAI